MYKKILVVLLCVLICFPLSGCGSWFGIKYSLALDEDLHTPINDLGNGQYEIKGQIYYLPPIEFLNETKRTIEASGKYEYIGWTGDRILYSEFYGDSRESPVFVYVPNTNHTLLRTDYDYKADTYLIEGTTALISLGEDLLDTGYTNTELFNRKCTEIIVSSETHPTLTARLHIVLDNGAWYAISNTHVGYKLSEHFVNVLVENEIISAP